MRVEYFRPFSETINVHPLARIDPVPGRSLMQTSESMRSILLALLAALLLFAAPHGHMFSGGAGAQIEDLGSINIFGAIGMLCLMRK